MMGECLEGAVPSPDGRSETGRPCIYQGPAHRLASPSAGQWQNFEKDDLKQWCVERCVLPMTARLPASLSVHIAKQ